MTDHADIDHTGLTGVDGLASGTSFPGTPSSGDFFLRTDRLIVYQYDGTRWLCVCPHEMQFTTRAAVGSGLSTTTSLSAAPTHGATRDIYVQEFRCAAFAVSTGFDASNLWTATLDKRDSANAATTIGTLTMNSQTANNWKQWLTSINAEVAGGTHLAFQLILTKTLSPGNIIPAFEVTYRYKG